MKRILPLALGGAMLLSLSVPAMATNATKNAWVNYSNVTIVADGAPIVPRAGGDSGTAVEPFVWNGTTYLPLRAAAAALGITVGWDGATSTISLTSGGKRIAPVISRSGEYYNMERSIPSVGNGTSQFFGCPFHQINGGNRFFGNRVLVQLF